MYRDSRGSAGRRKSVCVIILLVGIWMQSFSLTRCGQKEVEESSQMPPILKEPVSRSDSLCRVIRGRVGIPQILFASVVPEETTYSYEATVRVEKILVQVGERVKKGDILARVDLTETRHSLEGLRRELEKEKKTYRYHHGIALQQRKQLRAEKTHADTLKQSTKEIRRQIHVLRENMRYDQLMYQRKKKSLEKRIAAQKKSMREGVLRCEGSGVVSYVKDISGNLSESLSTNGEGDLNENIMEEKGEYDWANSGEPVVTVSEDSINKACLEVDDVTLKQYRYGDYEKKVLRDGTKEYPLTEVSYPEQERMIFAATEEWPKLRFECSKKMKRALALGETYPLYFFEKDEPETLVIPCAAVVGERSVYVRTNGDGRERREVTPGTSDGSMVQVISGLSEGEAVYCQYENGIPDTVMSEEVRIEDYYSVASKSRSGQRTSYGMHAYRSDFSGRVIELAVSEGEQVKKGQLLYILDTGEGKAHLTELRYQIQREEERFKRERKDYMQKRKKIEKKLGRWKDKKTSTEEHRYQSSILHCEKKILDFSFALSGLSHENSVQMLREEYEKVRSAGGETGQVRVYADRSGKIKSCFIQKGEKLASGAVSLVLRVKTQGCIEVKVNVNTNNPEKAVFGRLTPSFGAECVIESQGEKKRGVCVGVKREGAYESKPVYYIKMEETGKEKSTAHIRSRFYYARMRKVVILDESKIFKETLDDKSEGYYVWRVVEEGAVKQRVVVQSDLAVNGQQIVLYGLSEGDRVC